MLNIPVLGFKKPTLVEMEITYVIKDWFCIKKCINSRVFLDLKLQVNY